MLTQFSQFKQGSDIAQGIRRAVVTGKGLSLERLGLLLQVCCSAFFLSLIMLYVQISCVLISVVSVLHCAWAGMSGRIFEGSLLAHNGSD